MILELRHTLMSIERPRPHRFSESIALAQPTSKQSGCGFKARERNTLWKWKQSQGKRHFVPESTVREKTLCTETRTKTTHYAPTKDICPVPKIRVQKWLEVGNSPQVWEFLYITGGSQSQGWSLGIPLSFPLYKPSLFAAHDLSCRVLVATVTAAAATTTSTAVAASGRRTIVSSQ